MKKNKEKAFFVFLSFHFFYDKQRFMANIIEQATKYRIRGIEISEAEYYQQLTKVLDKIEDDIASLANKMLPITDGKLINLQQAIAIRPQIKAILEKHYLPFADRVVRQGFSKQALRVEKAFKAIGFIPPEFQELTKGDLALVKNLKQQYFTQFKDISNTFTRTLSDKVYQNTLLGSEFTELEKELRQSINGIYSSSNDPQMNKLVDYVKRNKDDLSKATLVDKAVKTLQTKFGADRAGNNMKRYAGQLLNDSLRDFDATLNFNKSKDAGLTYVKYYGDIIPETRQICRSLVSGSLNKRKNGLFTVDEVKSMWSSRSWSGKKFGNPLVVRGGYNCRHQWSFVNPDWYEDDAEVLKDTSVIKKELTKTTTAVNVTSLSNRIQHNKLTVVPVAVSQARITKQLLKNGKDKRYPRNPDGSLVTRFQGGKTAGQITGFNKLSEKIATRISVIMDELDELAIQYNIPKLRGIAVDFRSSNVAAMGDGTLRIGNSIDRKIFGTHGHKKLEDALVAAMKNPSKKAFGVEAYMENELDSMRAVLYHEFGHHVHQYTGIVANSTKANLRYTKIEKKLAVAFRGRKLRSATSYADKNAKEWFAENFSLYHNNKKDLCDPVFIDFLEEIQNDLI